MEDVFRLATTVSGRRKTNPEGWKAISGRQRKIAEPAFVLLVLHFLFFVSYFLRNAKNNQKSPHDHPPGFTIRTGVGYNKIRKLMSHSMTRSHTMNPFFNCIQKSIY